MAVLKTLFVLCVILVFAVLGTPVTVKKHSGFKVPRNYTIENTLPQEAAEIKPKVIAKSGTPVTKEPSGFKLPTNDTLENSSLKAEENTPEGNIARNNLPPVVISEGVCGKTRRPLIYTENFILENDKKSQVFATMRIGISGKPNITCVTVISRSHDEVRPMILSGGVGSNFVEVGVKPGYGNGFDFTVKLFGSYNLQETDAISATNPTDTSEPVTPSAKDANNTTIVMKADV